MDETLHTKYNLDNSSPHKQPKLKVPLFFFVFFLGVKDSEDEEEENNTSPVKRPASLMSGKKPPLVDTSLCSTRYRAEIIPKKGF